MTDVPAARRMLIVEDEQKMRQLLTDFFTARGFAVTATFSGEEALAMLATQPVEVVLLDILLPGMSGMEVLRRMKRQQPSVKVVIVSALDQDHLRMEARRYGACEYITKPFELNTATWAAVFAPV